jgi:hypothetical protein
MMEVKFDEQQLRSLESAIKRNPQVTLTEVGKFLARGIAVYNRGIIRSPWRIGMTGGGSPVSPGGGNLRDTHKKTVSQFSAKIEPNAHYAKYVHEGTKRMKARPWLDHVFTTSQQEIEKLEKDLLDKITNDLAT